MLGVSPIYQLMRGSEEVVGWIAHEVDTRRTVQVCKSVCHDGKMCQSRA